MGFVVLNGLDIDVSKDDGFNRSYEDVGAFERSEGMTLEGMMHREVRVFDFTIPIQFTDRETQSQRGWIKGRGHFWNFERVDGATTRFNKYPTDGGPGFDSSLGSTATSKFGAWAASVASAGTSTASVTFGSEDRYSISVWKRVAGNAYQLCSVVADGTTTTSFAGTGATTAFPWWTISAASGRLAVSLNGKDEQNASTTGFYDGLMIVPYALTTSQLAARNARTTAIPPFPYLELDGDCLEDLSPIVVKGFIGADESDQVTSGGAVVNVRIPTVKLIQR